MIKYDNEIDEMMARGGSFDLTGTGALITKQFFAFEASDGAVIASIKGVPIENSASTLAQIRDAEVDVSALFVTNLAAGLMAGGLYRIDGYVITSVQLTSGFLHLYMTRQQITS